MPIEKPKEPRQIRCFAARGQGALLIQGQGRPRKWTARYPHSFRFPLPASREIIRILEDP